MRAALLDHLRECAPSSAGYPAASSSARRRQAAGHWQPVARGWSDRRRLVSSAAAELSAPVASSRWLSLRLADSSLPWLPAGACSAPGCDCRRRLIFGAPSLSGKRAGWIGPVFPGADGGGSARCAFGRRGLRGRRSLPWQRQVAALITGSSSVSRKGQLERQAGVPRAARIGGGAVEQRGSPPAGAGSRRRAACAAMLAAQLGGGIHLVGVAHPTSSRLRR